MTSQRPVVLLAVALFATATVLLLAARTQSSALSFFRKSESPPQPRYAYVQYAADLDTVCHAMMMFDRLRELQVTAELVLLYSDELHDAASRDLLRRIERRYHVHLHRAAVLETLPGWGLDGMYRTSGLKLQMLGLVEYDRLIYLDSDATLYKSLDHLFALPSTDIALTRATWLPQPWFHSAFLVVEPSLRLYEKLLGLMRDERLHGYDMELINWLCGLHGTTGDVTFGSPHCLVLPHRPYAMLTLELHQSSHEHWLGYTEDHWDAQREMDALHYLHFSGSTKPWRFNTQAEIESEAPTCSEGVATCIERTLWVDAQWDFKARRLQVCGADF